MSAAKRTIPHSRCQNRLAPLKSTPRLNDCNDQTGFEALHNLLFLPVWNFCLWLWSVVLQPWSIITPWIDEDDIWGLYCCWYKPFCFLWCMMMSHIEWRACLPTSSLVSADLYSKTSYSVMQLMRLETFDFYQALSTLDVLMEHINFPLDVSLHH